VTKPKVSKSVSAAQAAHVVPPLPADRIDAALNLEDFRAPAPESKVIEDFNIEDFRAAPGPISTPVDGGVAAVRVRKPGRLDFVFVHPAWREFVFVIPEDFRKKRDAHLVLTAVAEHHPRVCRKVLLYPYGGDDGNFYLWPVPQEDAAGRLNDYSKSVMEQIERSIGHWSQFEANQGNQSYTLYFATTPREEPKWPDGGMPFFIKKAFEDRIIRTKDHPIFATLRGRKV